jgi:uncharacterized protein (DUF58 family)
MIYIIWICLSISVGILGYISMWTAVLVALLPVLLVLTLCVVLFGVLGLLVWTGDRKAEPSRERRRRNEHG